MHWRQYAWGNLRDGLRAMIFAPLAGVAGPASCACGTKANAGTQLDGANFVSVVCAKLQRWCKNFECQP